MSKIECKYKFHDAEKFDGKPYCTLQNELCEDLSFACDTNCQVFEDYKQLHRYKQAIEEIKDIAETCNKTSRCFDCKYHRACAYIDITKGYSYEVVQFILQKCEEINANI